MARLRRLTLCTALVLATWSNPASAAGEVISGAVKAALQRQAVVRGETAGAAMDRRALRLPLGGALALAEPLLRAAVADDQRHRLGLKRTVVASSPGLGGVWVQRAGGTEEARLSYPVSSTVSLGVGYSYVTMEDLAFEVAGPGFLEPDYDSHHLLIRAHWQF